MNDSIIIQICERIVLTVNNVLLFDNEEDYASDLLPDWRT